MNKQIRVRAIRRKEPDIHLYVLALIGLARQLQEEDARRAAGLPQAQAGTGEEAGV